MRSREERREQLRRMDAWLSMFHRNSPVLFALFTFGLALLFAGLVLKISEWLAP